MKSFNAQVGVATGAPRGKGSKTRSGLLSRALQGPGLLLGRHVFEAAQAVEAQRGFAETPTIEEVIPHNSRPGSVYNPEEKKKRKKRIDRMARGTEKSIKQKRKKKGIGKRDMKKIDEKQDTKKIGEKQDMKKIEEKRGKIATDDKKKTEPAAQPAEGDGGWTLVTRRHRFGLAARKDYTSITVWGIPPSVPDIVIWKSLLKPIGPLPEEEVQSITLRRYGPLERRCAFITFVSRLARDVRFHATRVACDTLGWKAVVSRTLKQRMRHRRDRNTPVGDPQPARSEAVPSGRFAALAHVDDAAHRLGNIEMEVPSGAKTAGPTSVTDKRLCRLKLGSLNVQGGLKDTIGELESYFHSKRYDIVALSETRLHPKSRLSVKGYKLISFPQKDGSGGVGFLVAHYLSQYCSRLKPSAANQGWISVKGSGGLHDLYLCSAYMPQESDAKLERAAAWSALQNSGSLYQSKGKVIILGDLNAQLGRPKGVGEARILGPFSSAGRRSPNGALLASLMRELRLVNTAGHSRPPSVPGFWYTRYDRPRDVYTQIDYILVDEEQHARHRSKFYVDYTDLSSDHHLLSAYFYWPRQLSRRRPHRILRRIAFEKLRGGGSGPEENVCTKYAEAIRENFGTSYKPAAQAKGLSDKAERSATVLGDFLGKMEKALESSVGLKTVSKRFTRPWFDGEVRRAVDRRRKAYKKFRETKTSSNWDQFQRLRNACKTLIRRKKREVWEKTVEQIAADFGDSNMRQFWSGLKRILPGASKGLAPGPIRDSRGTLATSVEGRLHGLNIKRSWVAQLLTPYSMTSSRLTWKGKSRSSGKPH